MDGYNIRAVIVDDHPVIRIGIELELARTDDVHVVGSASNSSGLIELLSNRGCDVVVTDYAMPGGAYGDGLELLGYIRENFEATAIVVLTGIDRTALIRNLRARGIANIVSKADACAHVVPAVKAAVTGSCYYSPAIARLLCAPQGSDRARALSPREAEVLSLFAKGKSVADIAEQLQRSKQTVSAQKIRAMNKLGLQNEAELVAHVMETGLFTGVDRST